MASFCILFNRCLVLFIFFLIRPGETSSSDDALTHYCSESFKDAMLYAHYGFGDKTKSPVTTTPNKVSKIKCHHFNLTLNN